MQRACAAALLRKGTTHILMPGRSADDRASLQIIQQLGALVNDNGSFIEIISKGIAPVNNILHCGESGLAARMFTPIAAISGQPQTITGTGSLLQRPMHFFETVLPSLGVTVSSNNGCLPLQLCGPLQPVDIEIDGSLSSQFVTGLLMAYAGAGAKDVTVKIRNAVSKPYIQLTINVLKEFGLHLPEENQGGYYFPAGEKNNPAQEILKYEVEGDWSGAAFLLVAGAIAGNITVTGISTSSAQADRAILKALQQCGADMVVAGNSVTVKAVSLSAFEFDATDCPDLVPPLCVLAACCKGTTLISGIERLKYKESDRAFALQQELGKMGIVINYNETEMRITGTEHIKGADTDAHNDHRIAMACAVAGLRAEGQTTVTGAGSVTKSYPDFFSDLQKLGAALDV
jgi:3-phosphoshikimate 1-carboxyvinyltransferase